MQVVQLQKLLLGETLDSAISKPASAIGSQGSLVAAAAAIAPDLSEIYKHVQT